MQVSLDTMWEDGELRISDYYWEFAMKDGKKKYNVFKARASDPRKQYEFDRILHCLINPFSNERSTREIILIFEMKYRGELKAKFWDYFLDKLADTFDFGCIREVLDRYGNNVKVRVPKMNVVPVMVVPYQGKNNITIHKGKNDIQVNFAQYVLMQGGILIFTNEFESYLRKKLRKAVSFKRMFKQWFRNEEEEREFTRVSLEYLFGR